ncbi:MAG TPA: flagellar hook-basal body complex protein, partial [Xanthobacteraceae bacterium]|nr:flagellar hook-basal body complex protein [Xanthobacteraceae bacterium]
MGIFEALSTAVSGLRTQSTALQNISGNISNSQTPGFKRTETSFADMIVGDTPRQQISGNVNSFSVSTNSVQGSPQPSAISTFMAINGNGYFVVQKPVAITDGKPVFDGVNLYSRRGDFKPDKNGFLVNGSGYYLMGIPIDPTTGNPSGSIPSVLQFNSDFLPAQATTAMQYRANLAKSPQPANFQKGIANSELLNSLDFESNPVAGPAAPAKIFGGTASILPDQPAGVTGTLGGLVPGDDVHNAPLNLSNGDSITLDDGSGTTRTYTVAPGDTVATLTAQLTNGNYKASLDATGHLKINLVDFKSTLKITGAPLPAAALLSAFGLPASGTAFQPVNLLTQGKVAPGQTLDIQVGALPALHIQFGTGVGQVYTLNQAVGGLQGALNALAIPANNLALADVDSVGNIQLQTNNLTDTITIQGQPTIVNPVDLRSFGTSLHLALPSDQHVVGADVPTFIKESLSGGSITGYDVSGAPVNVVLRWAKISSVASSGVDKWNLFYQTNSNATGAQVAWQNVGTDFTFTANGQLLSPVSPNVPLDVSGNVTVDGVSLGNVTIQFGTGGLTQFSDQNGGVSVNTFTQDGSAAGSLETISVNDQGRVDGTFTNGRTVDLAEITLANF